MNTLQHRCKLPGGDNRRKNTPKVEVFGVVSPQVGIMDGSNPPGGGIWYCKPPGGDNGHSLLQVEIMCVVCPQVGIFVDVSLKVGIVDAVSPQVGMVGIVSPQVG